MKVLAKEKGIAPGRDVTAELGALLRELRGNTEELELIFEPGEYGISAAGCEKEMLYITNTVGDDEFKAGETPHLAAVALNLKELSNLKISGSGTVFAINGKATNIAVQNCENLEINGIAIKTVNPDFHELKVIKKSAFSVDFELRGGSRYEKNKSGRGFSFTGTDYKTGFFEGRNTWGYLHKILAGDSGRVERVKHPFFAAVSIKEVEPNRFRVTYPNTSRFTVGETYGIYNARRQYNGIFIDKSRNIALKKVKQHFNYGLALVCQDTEDLTVDGAVFAPEDNSGRFIASCADFMQVCMCKGNINIINSYFEGAGDDCLNVHGIHFEIKDIEGNKLKVRFMHPQSHGFNPLHRGDTVEYINKKDLLTRGSAVITGSRLLNEYDIELTVDSVKCAEVGAVIEDITMCPDLYFAGNTLNRIITRGLLITTRGKVVIENNHFINTSMSSILFSNDAESWYESGRVQDVLIHNNTFGYCGSDNILIKPENSVYNGAVHSNFTVENNRFESAENGGIDIKATDKVTIRNNTVKFGKTRGFVRTKDVTNLVSDME